MATVAPSVMPGMAVLPQFAGDAYKIQRQQALANALMQQSFQNQGDQLNQTGAGMRVMPRMNPLQPLVQALGGYYSGKMADQAAQAQQTLGQQQMSFLMGDPGQPATPQPQPTPDQATPQPVAPQPQPQGNPLGDALLNQPGAQPPVQAPTGPQAAPVQPPATTGRPGFLAPGGPMNPAGIPGPMAAYMYLNSPDKYWEAQAAQYKPADVRAQIRAAGVDPDSAYGRALAQQDLTKKLTNVENVREGGTVFDLNTRQPIFNAPKDGQYIQYGQQGPQSVVVPNAAQNQQAWSQAQASGKAAVTPVAGFNDVTNKPEWTNQLNASQGGAAPGSNVNTGRFGGYNAPNGSGVVRPGPGLGANAAADAQANQNTKRSGSLIDLAAESPTRVNVLDNIINLSKSGVATGPSSEWINNLKGPVAQLTGNDKWSNDVANFQEMKKFMMQNSMRAWQAAGGSGTDAQLDAAMKANVNDKMFPQAVQTIGQWAKAGEVALQAKAGAQDDWLARNGNNPQAQNQFESAWRKNFDPRIYQAQVMDPGERATFVAKQPDAAALKAKIGVALQNGWIK